MTGCWAQCHICPTPGITSILPKELPSRWPRAGEETLLPLSQLGVLGAVPSRPAAKWLSHLSGGLCTACLAALCPFWRFGDSSTLAGSGVPLEGRVSGGHEVSPGHQAWAEGFHGVPAYKCHSLRGPGPYPLWCKRSVLHPVRVPQAALAVAWLWAPGSPRACCPSSCWWAAIEIPPQVGSQKFVSAHVLTVSLQERGSQTQACRVLHNAQDTRALGW